MRILHILPTLDPASGGPLEGVSQSGVYLTRQGHTVEVLTLDDGEESYVTSFPLIAHALGPSRRSYRYAARLVPWLTANGRNYDAVIVNGIWQYHCLGTWRALRNSGTPYYVFVHGMLDPWFKRAHPLKHLKKWLYWPWGVYRVLRDAQAVLFTCEEERLLARQSFWLYRAHEKIVKFGTAAPPADAPSLRELFFSAYPHLRATRNILFLSRVHEKKGCDLLIRAFAKARDSEPALHLIMAGPGEQALVEALQALATSLGVSSAITWTGMLTPPLKWAAFYCSEVFALPSHQENFGVAVAEALGCRLPVLISNKVNIWREIAEEGAGIVFADTLEGTEAGLGRWLTLSVDERAAMSRRAYETFNKHFTIEAMGSSMIDLLVA